MLIRRSKRVHHGDFLQLIDFQQLSEFQNILNLCPKIQIHQQMLFHAVNVFNFRTTADYFRVRIEFFFSSKNCGLFSSAGYFRVNWVNILDIGQPGHFGHSEHFLDNLDNFGQFGHFSGKLK